jgi:hypothetical protein
MKLVARSFEETGGPKVSQDHWSVRQGGRKEDGSWQQQPQPQYDISLLKMWAKIESSDGHADQRCAGTVLTMRGR